MLTQYRHNMLFYLGSVQQRGATMKLIPITVPKDYLAADKYKKVVEDALDTAALAAQSNFETTTATWKHEVKFRISTKPAERIIATDDEIFGYVEGGTRPHLIGPRRARYLRFATGYRAKTRPGQLGSTSGGANGPVVYFRGVVEHPGTKARHFAKVVAKKAQERLLLELNLGFGKVT